LVIEISLQNKILFEIVIVLSTSYKGDSQTIGSLFYCVNHFASINWNFIAFSVKSLFFAIHLSQQSEFQCYQISAA